MSTSFFGSLQGSLEKGTCGRYYPPPQQYSHVNAHPFHQPSQQLSQQDYSKTRDGSSLLCSAASPDLLSVSSHEKPSNSLSGSVWSHNSSSNDTSQGSDYANSAVAHRVQSAYQEEWDARCCAPQHQQQQQQQTTVVAALLSPPDRVNRLEAAPCGHALFSSAPPRCALGVPPLSVQTTAPATASASIAPERVLADDGVVAADPYIAADPSRSPTKRRFSSQGEDSTLQLRQRAMAVPTSHAACRSAKSEEELSPPPAAVGEASTPAVPACARLDGKDHLSPELGSHAVRRPSRNASSGPRASLPPRRPSSASVPTVALSLVSRIPAMTVSPQTVVDHFHDPYANASYPPSRAASPYLEARLPHQWCTLGDSGASALLMALSSSSSSAGRDKSGIDEEWEEEERKGEVGEGDGVPDDEDDEGEWGPPRLASTRRQSLDDSRSSDGGGGGGEAWAGQGEGSDDLSGGCDGGGAFAPVSVTPPPPPTGDATALPSPHTGACGGAQGPRSQRNPAAAAAESKDAGSVCGCSCPAEKAATAVRTHASVPECVESGSCSNRGAVSCGSAVTPPSSAIAAAVSVSFPSKVYDSPSVSELATVEAAQEAGATTCATPPVEFSSLPSTPPSPPLAATPRESVGGGSGGVCSATTNTGSVPRRPPRPLFSSLPSPQQLSLSEAALPLPPSPAKARRGGGGGGVDCLGTEGGDSRFAAPCRDGDAATAPPSSPPSSLPPSPEELDLTQLVQQHVSQRIASSYAQSCSYYLHYHAKHGAAAAVGSGQTLPLFSGEAHGDDDGGEEGEVWQTGEKLRAVDKGERDEKGGATAMGEETDKSPSAAAGTRLPVEEAVATVGSTASTAACTSSTPPPPPPSATAPTAAEQETKSSGCGPHQQQQQPRWRRFSCAVAPAEAATL